MAATQNGSLGLVSMRERVRLVRGQISIESRKGEGTRIKVQVPLGGGEGLPVGSLATSRPYMHGPVAESKQPAHA